MDKEKIAIKLSKVRTLAESGIDGEKESAQQLLEELLKKYEMTLEDLTDELEEVKDYIFWYHGEEELRLLNQIMWKITDNPTYYELSRERKIRNRIKKECTYSQKLEIEFLFGFYKRLYYEERERLLLAFIYKHDLYGKSQSDDSSQNKHSEEEIRRIARMASTLSDEKPLLAIESGEDK